MHLSDRTAVAGIVAGIAGGGMVAFLKDAFPSAPPWLWQVLFPLFAIVLLFSIAYLIDEHFSKPRLRRALVGPAILIIISTLGFMAGIAWTIYGRIPLIENTSPEIVKNADLEDLFKKDFPDLISIDRTVPFRIQDDKQDLDISVDVKFRTFEDFISNTDFVSVYIPFLSDIRLQNLKVNLIEVIRDNIQRNREE